MDIRLIGMFNAALSNEKRLDFNMVNNEAMKRGFIVHPDACTQSVLDYLKTLDINVNATFYKEWSDILSKSRFELFIDQIIHYATTYGTDYQGTPYIPNTGAENVPIVHFDKFKVIVAISEEELFNRCMGLIQSGIALNNDTLDAVCKYIISQVDLCRAIDIDSIKNREALIRICDACRLYPNNPDKLLHLIVFKTTGNAMIIKNDDTIRTIYGSSSPFQFAYLNDKQLTALSRIFYRYRKIFLAFRKVSDKGIASMNAVVINEIRRRACKNHVPMQTPFCGNVLNTYHADDEIVAHLGELNNYKKITLLQAINENLFSPIETKKIYLVRNGRVYVKDRKHIGEGMLKYQEHLYSLIKQSIVESLKGKATYYRIPEGLDIACPTSEKNFIGNYPIGTNFQLSTHNFVGIYWKEEWGTNDFDLSIVDDNGCRIGWNSHYRNEGDRIIYSGDMTQAYPEAAEVLYTRGKFPNTAIFKVNRYNGREGSTFKVFIGIETNTNNPAMYWVNSGGYSRNVGLNKCGYMVDPNSIKFMNEYTSTDRETTLGIVLNDRFYVTNLRTGNASVSNHRTETLNALVERLNYTVSLREILDEAGFIDFEQNRYVIETKEDGTQVAVEREWKEGEYLDFSQLAKDSLINLFA